MPWLTAENAPVFQELFNSVARDKPSIGATIRVIYGKHSGKIGTVTRHMLSRYKHPFRYGNAASHAMTQARGRGGYVVLVKTEMETFWVDADKVMLCVEN
jgi:hypothetical protein